MATTADNELTLQLAVRLRSERLRINMNPKDFGNLGGVSERSQFNYENGERLPDALYLARLALLENVDIQYIVTGQRTRMTEGVTTEERQLLDLFTPLPPIHRDFVAKAAILSNLAWRDHGGTIGGLGEVAAAH